MRGAHEAGRSDHRSKKDGSDNNERHRCHEAAPRLEDALVAGGIVNEEAGQFGFVAMHLPRRSARDVGGSRGGQAPGSVQQRRQLGDAGKNYSSNHYSTLTQINAENVKNLKVSWSFSTGLLSGHEGAPLVVDGKMYIHTSFPNNTFALNLDDPTRILWQDKPKQSAAARAVACCDIVNRGLAYWPGDGFTPSLIIKTLLDGNVVALNAETGATYWKIEIRISRWVPRSPSRRMYIRTSC